jgi:hypothetical protein
MNREPAFRHLPELDQVPAIEQIDKAILDPKLAIDGEQQWKSSGPLWIDVLFTTRLPPAAAQPVI